MSLLVTGNVNRSEVNLAAVAAGRGLRTYGSKVPIAEVCRIYASGLLRPLTIGTANDRCCGYLTFVGLLDEASLNLR